MDSWTVDLHFARGRIWLWRTSKRINSNPSLGRTFVLVMSMGPEVLAQTCLGPPVVPFYPFLGEGSPPKIDYWTKDALVLTSLLEDLDVLHSLVVWNFCLPCQQATPAIHPLARSHQKSRARALKSSGQPDLRCDPDGFAQQTVRNKAIAVNCRREVVVFTRQNS